MNPEFAININSLGVCYDSHWVIKDFCLKIDVGEKVTLTGPSGCGKSTVLRCLLGLVVPDCGEINILGRTINGHNIWEIRRNLAYVAQEADLGTGTVREIVEKPFSYRANTNLVKNLDRLPELMDQFNLPASILGKQISNLSGGEKQRIALVIAILMDRDIVLLDEASSALDRENKKAIADYFQTAENMTVLSVAHDVEWLGFSNRVINIAQMNSRDGEKE